MPLPLFPPFSLVSPSYAFDEPFTSPANWGGTGLMEIPTARVMRENRYRLGIGQVKPYRTYYGAISPLRGLEIDGRITEVLDVPSGLEGQGNYKDKAVDLKYQFLAEGKYLPAFSIGIMDPHGTRVYPSQYIVASKQLYPFDLSLGFGNGRFGKRPLVSRTENFKLEMVTDFSDWLQDSQWFWGIQFAPSGKYSFMMEYSPIKFHEQRGDPARSTYFTDPVPSKFNFGIRYKPASWSELTVSYQRGEEIGFQFSTAFDIGNPLIPIERPVYRESILDRRSTPEARLTTALSHLGFSDIGVAVIDKEVWVEAQNEQYYFAPEAIGVMLRTIDGILPDHAGRVHIVLRENGMPRVHFMALRQDIRDLFSEKLTLKEFLYLSAYDTDLVGIPAIRGSYRKSVKYGWKPGIETFLNDPSGFFKYRLGVSGWISYHPWKGASFVASVEGYPLNDISTSNEPLSIPVRSDLVFYKSEKISLGRMMFDQIHQVAPGVYGRISAGLLEIEYGGIDAEMAMPLFDGRVLIGTSGSVVKKRDPDEAFHFLDDEVKDHYTTVFFNARLNIPEYEVAIDVKAGKFLAGDKGVRVTVSKFIKGVIIWAWYSATGTSVFSDPYNEGYHDKGIGVSIPMRLFSGTESRSTYTYTLSPWTRDAGQDIDHFGSLFDFIGRYNKIYLDRDRKFMYR